MTDPTAPAGTDPAMHNTTTIPAGIFRAYDIRGIAGTELTPRNISVIGRGIGQMAITQGIRRLYLGRDTRLSSPALADALRSGLLASGCDVIDLGTVPTPLLYFATQGTECDSGVMLTASHNPGEYNGIKIVMRRTCLTPEQIQNLLQLCQSLGAVPAGSDNAVRGSCQSRDIVPSYIKTVQQNIRLQRPLNVVVDCGNAVPGLVAPALLQALGCKVTALYCEPDGRFPNHHPDPTVSENLGSLIDQVRATGADLGIALDGDGDRVVVVSNSGAIIDTDRLLMLFVRDIVPRNKCKNVVFDVKCSKLLIDVIEQSGGIPVMSRSGHSFMKHRMQETGAPIGAEFSAHVFIRDRWYGYDDGLYVAARFIELLAASKGSVDDMLATLPASISTPELRIPVPEAHKFALIEQLQLLVREPSVLPDAHINDLDGVRAEFADGWGLVRASNTTPALLLRFEASSQQSLDRILQQFRQLLSRVDRALMIQI